MGRHRVNNKGIGIELDAKIDYAKLEQRILWYSIKDLMGTYKLFTFPDIDFIDPPCRRPEAPWSDIE